VWPAYLHLTGFALRYHSMMNNRSSTRSILDAGLRDLGSQLSSLDLLSIALSTYFVSPRMDHLLIATSISEDLT
jgi:hypothetical protein